MPTAAIHNLMATAGPKAASHAFVCNRNDNSLTAVNISNPSAMTFVSELTDATNLAAASDIAIDRTKRTAWIVASGHLTAVNIANPASMGVSGSYANAGIGGPSRVALDIPRQIAFVSLSGGILAINITNPASPVLISTLSISANATNSTLRLDVDRQLLFTTRNGGGALPSTTLRSIDVSDPASMAQLGTMSIGGGGSANNATDFAVNGSLVFYLTDNDGMFVVDAANPASMTIAHTYASGLIPASGQPTRSLIVGGVMVASFNTTDTIRSLNIADPASITTIDTVTSGTSLDGVVGLDVDPFNGNLYAASSIGDEITSFAMSVGVLSQLNNLASGTQLNGAYAVALL